MGFGQGHHLHLIDGSAFIFRAYHALPPLTRKSDGLPIGAVSGFCNMLNRYIEDNDGPDAPTHVAVIFDHSKQMFGRVANAVRVGSATPKIMQSLFSFIVGGMREEISNVLDKRTKCLVILKTSTLNGCAY